MTAKYLLYFDDTGSRDRDRSPSPIVRNDRMDCFGLGGILMKEEDIEDEAYEICGLTNPVKPQNFSNVSIAGKPYANLGRFSQFRKDRTFRI
jgi:hypothetical protein